MSAGVGRLAGFFERHREICKLLVAVKKDSVHTKLMTSGEHLRVMASGNSS